MSVIEFQNVTKTFPLSRGGRLLRVYLQDRLKGHHRQLFYALKDVSFRVEKGQSMAIIGRNGAGKSTLLGLVAGLAPPNGGRVEVNGRVAALLELGSGFHPDLTGRENVFLNASILGLTRKQTEKYFDSIAEFSGIGEFIEEPIRTYSSGMVVRLAFAVAIHINPEILIIDEVLAVGDQAFQDKCYERIREFKQQGKTLLFVSHSAGLVRRLCDRCVWLDHGQVRAVGDPGPILDEYSAAG
jgi:ABC-type polysaccharide/polyol phosphate transport system ATPase subunit